MSVWIREREREKERRRETVRPRREEERRRNEKVDAGRKKRNSLLKPSPLNESDPPPLFSPAPRAVNQPVWMPFQVHLAGVSRLSETRGEGGG